MWPPARRTHRLWCTAGFWRLGTPPKPSKSYAMGQYRAFLGAACETARAAREGLMVVKPRDHSRTTVIEDLRQAIADKLLTSAQASKIRGRSNWVATNTFGKICRLGVSVLRAIQYAPRTSAGLTERQCGHLEFHLQVIQRAWGRRIDLYGERDKPVVVYTDAEYTPCCQPRLGGSFSLQLKPSHMPSPPPCQQATPTGGKGGRTRSIWQN